MKKNFRLALIPFLVCSVTIPCYANSGPSTFLGPTVNLRYTQPLSDATAYSVLGEAGVKNWRLNATIGQKLYDNQRLKFSAEYLAQKITYSFFTGDSKQWVQQGAIGGLYEYIFTDNSYLPTFDFQGWYSHAPSKNLDPISGFIANTGGTFLAFTDNRRIAGSNAGGVAPGVSIHPWYGGLVGVDVNYDHVRYDKKYATYDRTVNGFGGTLRASQYVLDNVVVSGSAAIRQPFNNYTASVDWTNVPYYGNWTVGVNAGLVDGKHCLPNTWNVGLNLSYVLDQGVMVASSNRGQTSFSDDFVSWTAKPAVYLPQVLAVTDEMLSTNCTPLLSAIGTLADVTVPAGDTVAIATAGAFSATSGVTYSITVTPAPTPGASVTINPTTGVITAIANGPVVEVVTVVVTAANACGSATQTFDITLEE